MYDGTGFLARLCCPLNKSPIHRLCWMDDDLHKVDVARHGHRLICHLAICIHKYVFDETLFSIE